MDVCRWCGEPHDTTRLCQKAQRGLTRRSFCFLFGAGVASVATGGLGSITPATNPILTSATLIELHKYAVHYVKISVELLRDSMIRAEEIDRHMKLAPFQLDVEWNP